MIKLPPPPNAAPPGSPVWNDWYAKLQVLFTSVQSKASDPTTSDLAPGQWGIFKNTTSGNVKVWTNDNGTMKSVLLT